MGVKHAYSESEWTERKEFYINEASKINIPIDATITQLKQLISINNNLLTEAYFDKANIQESLSREERRLKLYEEETWASIDWDSISQTKLIEKEKRAYVAKYITKVTREADGIDLYSKTRLLASRYAFIESVVYNLKDRAGALFNLLSLLKLETEQSKMDSYIGASNL